VQDARVTRPSEFSREGNPIEAIRQSWLILGSLALGLLAYLAIAVALVRWAHPQVTGSAAFIPEFRHYVRPEPMERTLYLVGLISIPTLPTLFYGLLASGSRRFPGLWPGLASPYGLAARDGLVAGGVLLWLGFLAQRSQIPAASCYLAGACLLALLAPLNRFARLQERPESSVGNALRGVPGGGAAAPTVIPGTPRRAFPTDHFPRIAAGHLAGA
jgi:hypothetical protein